MLALSQPFPSQQSRYRFPKSGCPEQPRGCGAVHQPQPFPCALPGRALRPLRPLSWENTSFSYSTYFLLCLIPAHHRPAVRTAAGEARQQLRGGRGQQECGLWSLRALPREQRGPGAAPRPAGGRASAGSAGFTSAALGRLEGQGFKRQGLRKFGLVLRLGLHASKAQSQLVGQIRGGLRGEKFKKKIKKKS